MSSPSQLDASALENRVLETPEPSFIPGEIYSIEESKEWTCDNTPQLFNPSIYVKDERIDYRDWHVFATLCAKNNFLMRLRFPVKSPISKRGEIFIVSDPIVTKLIIFPKNQRERSVRESIDLAYSLIRKTGPHTSSFRQDAYRLADSSTGSELARLKIKIESAYRD